MGEDKRFLSIGEETLYEHSLGVLRSVFQSVVVVIAQDSSPIKSDVPVLRDLIPDCGSLGGLYTGLKQSATPSVFAVACDMPFLNPLIVRYFIDVRGAADLVMAKLQNGLQPMHALYHQRCLPAMERLLHAHELSIQRLTADPSLRVRLITADELSGMDPDGRSFYNVNTPADLFTARTIQDKTPPQSSS
jgi:molybdopterin-guanine dinucleotide biosynthesis protein A